MSPFATAVVGLMLIPMAFDRRSTGRISRVYLANGVTQLGFAAAWGFAAWRESRETHRLPEAAFA